jgi:hypothetical protein
MRSRTQSFGLVSPPGSSHTGSKLRTLQRVLGQARDYRLAKPAMHCAAMQLFAARVRKFTDVRREKVSGPAMVIFLTALRPKQEHPKK